MSRGELARKIYKRGKCPTCGYRYRLTKEGLLYNHEIYRQNLPPERCLGSGKEPEPPKETTGPIL